MKQYTERMASLLPDVSTLSVAELRFILAKYGTFVELLSFWSIMWFAYYRVKSEAGKEALIDNIICEGKDSHQMMLNTFLYNCWAYPDQRCQEIMREALVPSWGALQRSCQQDSAFVHIVFLALAENTSLVFIPWLRKAAENVGCSDFTYTDVHWEADIKHAQLFEKALYEEKSFLAQSDSDLEVLVNIYFDLMRKIFTPWE